VGLGVVVAIAVPHWPYDRTCGVGLLVYLLAVATVFVTGIWGATASWRVRVAAAHVVALCTILWSLAVAADEIVSRTAYVSVPVSWQCGPLRGVPRPALPARLEAIPRPPA
jgi:hypothetical protein